MEFIVLLLFCILFFYWLCYTPCNRGWSKEDAGRAYFIVLFVIFMSLYILKDSYSLPDLPDYFIFFDRVKKIPIFHFILTYDTSEYIYDMGWGAYNIFLSYLWPNHNVIIMANGILVLLVFFSFIKQYSESYWISLLLFVFCYFYLSCFILRQFVAISICVFSIRYILSRNIIKFFLLILLAIQFHETAIVFSVLYFLYNIRFGIIYVIGALFLAVLGIQFKDILVQFFIENLGTSSAYLDVWYNNGEGGVKVTTYIIGIIIFIFVFLFSDKRKIVGINKIMLDALILSIIVSFACVGLDGTFARLNLYFYISYLILIPMTCKCINVKSVRICFIITILLCFGYQFMNAFNYGFKI